ncbi:CLUMA_CG018157, isoform A [Clunio marinus]|uniref:CLUMA_CG018157, isoform A n=1 Tax=Clunio marinus TaxID=568069 RepID=A0A1J1J0F9_9DIPT|nr:CLUMA_CG018157, isoform A [Clunio marinus]
MANYRGRSNTKAVASETLSLLSRKPKKRIWKVKAAPENDEDEDEGAIKEVDYTKAPFDTDKVYQLISDIVDKTFLTEDEEPYVYNANENVNLCQRISKEIRDSLKTWRQLMRYRIIAMVSVVEKNHQGIHMKMKHLVDPKTDNFVKYYLDNPNFYILVFVVLIFQD